MLSKINQIYGIRFCNWHGPAEQKLNVLVLLHTKKNSKPREEQLVAAPEKMKNNNHVKVNWKSKMLPSSIFFS